MSSLGWRVEDLDHDEMILNMGPQHPSTHGVLRIELRTGKNPFAGRRNKLTPRQVKRRERIQVRGKKRN